MGKKLFKIDKAEKFDIEEISTSDIAIVGIAGQLPMAENIDDFWNNQINKVDCVRAFPDKRKQEVVDYFKSQSLNFQPEDVKFKKKAYLNNIDGFDYIFFGFTHKEASLMNPSQRLFLETTWHMIDDAGYSKESLYGSNTGIFIGNTGANKYLTLIEEMEPELASMAYPSNLPSVIGSRISYMLDLKGPSLLLDTACSSSMLALHLGCQSIKNGECEQAIIGGVNISLIPLQDDNDGLGILSKDSKTRTFDNSSDGTVGGEGCVSIMIKPLNKAVRDKDKIWAVIKGSASNNDGASAGITAPNSIAQEEVIVKAWENAKINPENISYIEAHGTGTALGDPIEIEGLTRAFARYTEKKQFCAIGSVKTNIGHLNSVSGLAGILKATLALHHKKLPPLLHFERPNKKIKFEKSPVYVCNELMNWDKEKLLCGVNSFGLSGTNCHVVLEEAPSVRVNYEAKPPYILLISAKTKVALFSLIESYVELLSESKGANIGNICYTSAVGRDHYNYRIAVVGSSKNDFIHQLVRLSNEYSKIVEMAEVQSTKLDNQVKQLLEQNEEKTQDHLSELADLYLKGVFINWSQYYKNNSYYRVKLPLYPFFKKRCWVEYKIVENKPKDIVVKNANERIFEVNETYETKDDILDNLKGIISEIYEMDRNEVNADITFFEMGLDSISIIQVRQLLKNSYELDIPISSLFDEVSNLNALADFVFEAQLKKPSSRRLEEAPIGVESNDKISGYLKKVIDQQLVLMEKQLELLSGKKVVETNGNDKRVTLKNDQAIKAVRQQESVNENYDIAQKQYLEKFIKRYNNKTLGSKNLTQEHRRVYANNRHVAGYRAELKDLAYPILADEAKSATIKDVDGNEYIDFCLGFGVYLLGYNPEIITNAITKQNEKGVLLGAMSPIAGQVAALISKMTGVDRVAFYNSGTEAVMVALRLARAARSRQKVVMFHGSYHGTYDGVLAQKDAFAKDHKAVPKATGIPPKMLEDVILLDYGTEESLEIIKKYENELAAVLVEPVQSRRPEFQPKKYLKDLRALTEELSIPLIFDEIITGFRIHQGGAQAFFDVKADLVTYGKVIGGGLPIGVVAGKAEFMHGVDAGGHWSYADDTQPIFDHRKTFVGGTFCTHPLTMAASKAILEFLDKKGPVLQDRLNKRTEYLVKSLNDFFEKNGFEIEIVNFGSLFQIRTEYDLGLIIYHFIDKGIYAWEGMTFFISHAHTDEQIDLLINTFKEVVIGLREDGFISKTSKLLPEQSEVINMTAEQRHLVVLSNVSQKATQAFTIFKSEKITGGFDQRAFDKVIKVLQERHEVLNVFKIDDQHLYIDSNSSLSIDTTEGHSGEVDDWVAEMKSQKIDLKNGPLLKIGILKTGNSFVFTLLAHQLILDGYSVEILLTEMGSLYMAIVNSEIINLPEAKKFSNYTEAVNSYVHSSKGQKALDYWVAKFKEPMPSLRFPVNPYFKRKNSGFGEDVQLELGTKQTLELKMFCKERNTSMFMVLLGLYEVFLNKLTQQNRFLIGTPTAGQLTYNYDYLVGQCANITPAVADLRGVESFTQLLKIIKSQRVADLEYQKLSYDSLISLLAKENLPDVQAVFNIDQAIGEAGGEVIPLVINSRGQVNNKYDLFFNAIEVNNSMKLTFQFSHFRFDKDIVLSWVEEFYRMVELIIDQRDFSLGKLWEAGAVEKYEFLLATPLSVNLGEKYLEEIEEFFKKTQPVILSKDGNGSVPFGVPGWIGIENNNESGFLTSDFYGRKVSHEKIEVFGKKGRLEEVNGQYIDLGLIELLIGEIDGVIECVTFPSDFSKGYFVVVTAESTSEHIEQSLLEYLPVGVMPKNIFKVNDVPRIASDQIDYKALQELSRNRQGEVTLSKVSAQLIQVFSQLLDLENLKQTDNFFELGGNSLKAVQLVARVNKLFDKKIELNDVFNNQTVYELEKAISVGENKKYEDIKPVVKKQYYDISHAQKRLWILDKFGKNQTAYLMPKSYLVKGEVDKSVFDKAINELVKRHESLRTHFITKDGEPKQVIASLEDSGFTLDYVDLSSSDSPDNEFAAIVSNETSTPFDLSHGPLLRTKLIKIEEARYGFLFTLHHIIADGWSMELLFNDFTKIYNELKNGKEVSLEPLPIQYKDYCAWLNRNNSDQFEADHEYWLNIFKGEIPVVNLPTKSNRPDIKTFNGKVEPFELGREAVEVVNRLCKEEKVSLYNVLLAFSKVLLYKYTHQTDLIVGAAVSGRSHEQLENQVGLYADTLAIRTAFGNRDSFIDVLSKVKRSLLDSFAHQNYPFDLLVEELNLKRDLSRSPLFDVMVEIQDIDATIEEQGSPQPLSGISIENYGKANHVSKYDLSIRFSNEAQIIGSIEYNTDLFEQKFIKQFIGHMNNLILNIGTDWSKPILDIKILSNNEVEEALKNGLGTELPLPPRETIVSLMKTKSMAFNKSTSISQGNLDLSYNELDAKSDALAKNLQDDYNVRSNDVIGVLADHSVETIISIWGILKAGAAFLPIDTNNTDEKIKFILDDAHVSLLFAHSENMFRVQEFYEEELFIMDIQLNVLDAADNFKNEVSPYDIAYVIYTSGSTGRPKGVTITHQNIYNYVMWANEYYFNGSNGFNFPLFTPIAFDLTLTSIFTTHLRGDKLVIPDSTKIEKTLLDIFNGVYDINAIKLTPSHISMLQHLNVTKTHIQKVIVGGEAFGENQFKTLTSLNRNIVVYNEYGPTETTIGCTVKRVENDISIGRPINNTEAYILDEAMNFVPNEVSGELYIGGVGVSRGYLNQPQLTSDRFILSPFKEGAILYKTGDLCSRLGNGDIQFLGRTDRQFKLRGYRIEPAEIEKVILVNNSIQNVFVTGYKSNGVNDLIVAYYTAEKPIDEEDLRRTVSKKLCFFMLPSHFIYIDKFPLTSNGKLAVDKLPSLPSLSLNKDDRQTHKPINSIERYLVKLWQDVLKVDDVGIEDDFFKLGGHSLKATQIISDIHKNTGIDIDISDLFAKPTIKELGEILTTNQIGDILSIKAIEDQDYYSLSYTQHRLWLRIMIGGEKSILNTSSAFILSGNLDKDLLARVLNTIVERHESLRTVIKQINVVPVQHVLSLEKCQFEIIDEPFAGHIKDLVLKESSHEFDIENDMLMRVRLSEIDKDKSVLIITFHHLVTDGWSHEVFMDEMASLYEAGLEKTEGVPLNKLTLQYKDYTAWLKDQLMNNRLSAHRNYWLSKFNGEVKPVLLPTDYNRKIGSNFEGGTINFEINKHDSQVLKQLCEKNQVSLFMTLISLLNILIYRLTWQKDIVIGTPIAGRNHKDLEKQIGPYFNILALRNQISDKDNFESFLKKVKETTLGSYKHQLYPFTELLEEIDIVRPDKQISSLFEVGLTWQNQSDIDARQSYKFNGLNVEPFKRDGNWALHELWFFGSEDEDKLSFRLRYRKDLFRVETVEKIRDMFLEIVTKVCSSEDNIHELCKSINGIDHDDQEKLVDSSRGLISEDF
ncbi:MAG: iturin family lipopeptide synthetase A [Cyclobacteriaceae bacterium]|jgi:iturin family lipopeptide synthetase A